MEVNGAMRILIVDDDVVILEILEIFLASIEYDDVKFAQSGAEAMAMIASNPEPFECILLDINMPQMSGIELLSKIREIKTYEFVPVIMLTAMGDRAHITSAFAEGAWDYIVKPFEMFELEARIHSAGLRNAEVKRLVQTPNDQFRTIEFPSKLRGVGGDGEAGPQSGLVSGDAFGNCFNSIVKQSPSKLGVLTMIIDDFDGLARKLSPEVFERHLVDLARRLTLQFADIQGIISYQGEGVFMALSFGFEFVSATKLQNAIEKAAAEADAKTLASCGHRTQILVGRVLSRDLPENVEPIYMLEMARSHLLNRSTQFP
jgi:CheY-like chemotaxis protein